MSDCVCRLSKQCHSKEHVCSCKIRKNCLATSNHTCICSHIAKTKTKKKRCISDMCECICEILGISKNIRSLSHKDLMLLRKCRHYSHTCKCSNNYNDCNGKHGHRCICMGIRDKQCKMAFPGMSHNVCSCNSEDSYSCTSDVHLCICASIILEDDDIDYSTDLCNSIKCDCICEKLLEKNISNELCNSTKCACICENLLGDNTERCKSDTHECMCNLSDSYYEQCQIYHDCICDGTEYNNDRCKKYAHYCTCDKSNYEFCRVTNVDCNCISGKCKLISTPKHKHTCICDLECNHGEQNGYYFVNDDDLHTCIADDHNCICGKECDHNMYFKCISYNHECICDNTVMKCQINHTYTKSAYDY